MAVVARRVAVLGVAIAATVAAGCMGGDEGNKAGSTDDALTLRIGTPDRDDVPAGDQINEFARRVEALSDGKLRIEPVWYAAGSEPGGDQRVARMVTSGELDMAVVPSRAWDTQGVTSLRALNAPFLITSDDLLADVLSGDVADRMLSGLDTAGVVGLALFPEGLRHPFGLPKPVLGPDDYRGQTIRAPRSNTTAAMFEALGATTNERRPKAGVHRAMESSYLLETFGPATGNVTFYPKVNSLVVNAGVFDRLSDQQREMLERAGAQTRQWAIEETPTDAEAASAFCQRGMAVVHASGADIAALERAVRPVYAKLEGDEQTEDIIDAIRKRKQAMTVSGAVTPECGEVDSADGLDSADDRGPRLNGVYRFEVSDQDLREAGVSDPVKLAENHGVVTYSFKEDGVCWRQRAPNPLANPDDCHAYAIDGDRLIFSYPEGDRAILRWRETPNGDLKLAVVSAPVEPELMRAWVANPWKRIGDAE